jgi:hypothetical protein
LCCSVTVYCAAVSQCIVLQCHSVLCCSVTVYCAAVSQCIVLQCQVRCCCNARDLYSGHSSLQSRPAFRVKLLSYFTMYSVESCESISKHTSTVAFLVHAHSQFKIILQIHFRLYDRGFKLDQLRNPHFRSQTSVRAMCHLSSLVIKSLFLQVSFDSRYAI